MDSRSAVLLSDGVVRSCDIIDFDDLKNKRVKLLLRLGKIKESADDSLDSERLRLPDGRESVEELDIHFSCWFSRSTYVKHAH